MDNVIPFPKDRLRPAGQASSPSPWGVILLVAIGIAAFEGFQYMFRPRSRRNPRRHRRAA